MLLLIIISITNSYYYYYDKIDMHIGFNKPNERVISIQVS